MSSSEAARLPAASSAPPDLQTLLRNGLRLPDSMAALRARFLQAKPFPHLILDGLFPDQVLEAVLAEAPIKRDDWMYFDHEGLQKVLRMRSSVGMGPASFELAACLHAAPFLYFLSELTGIWQLLPDPYLQGAGHAAMRRGMYFKIHSDRNVAYDTGLTRRLAMIIFLNHDWKREYAGQLELWNHEGTRCEVAVDPLFNRTVLFEVADPNYHGVPAALNCPADRSRQSFIVYYHTVGKEGATPAPHTSIFAPSVYQSRRPSLRRVAEASLPPLLFRALRRLLGRGT